MGIDRQLCVVETELLCAKLADSPAKTENFFPWKKTVPAGYDKMYIFREAVCKCADKAGNPAVCKQVKVINKNIAAFFPCQRMTQAVR